VIFGTPFIAVTEGPENPISHGTFAAMRDHQVTPYGSRMNLINTWPEGHNDQWKPKVLKGTASSKRLSHMTFRKHNSFWSFQLDDDSGYCYTFLEIGHPFSGERGFDEWGFQMSDDRCSGAVDSGNTGSKPSSKKSMYLFWRKSKASHVATLGAGWEQFWTFSSGFKTPTDYLGQNYNVGCLNKKDDNGMKFTDGVCFGRMPSNAPIDTTQLLVIDNHGQAYRWKFKSGCNTADHMFKARCSGFDINVHSRMLLDLTPAGFKPAYV
jgi:hypothetical protein